MQTAARFGGGGATGYVEEIRESFLNTVPPLHQPLQSWRAEIEPAPANNFWIVPSHGIPARLIAVRSGDGGQPFDVVACLDADPDRTYTLRGEAAIVGYENYDRAEITGQPVEIHRDPVAWLAAGCEGIAVTDWFLAPSLLRRLRAVVCQDQEHAARVHSAIKGYRPPLPAIRFHRRAAA